MSQERPNVESVLQAIKEAKVKTDAECSAAFELINSLREELDPTAIFMLQTGVIIEHFNQNKKPEDKQMTMVDAVALAFASRKHSLK